MDAAYQAGPWADLALGMVGAAAALAGLLFVAVANNLDVILSGPAPPGYAAQALILLVSPVFVGLCVLVPEQSTTALGTELIGLGVVLAAMLGWLARPAARAPDHTRWEWLLTNVLPASGLVAGLLLAGTGVLTTAVGGLYWLPAVFAAGLLGGLAIAWTLLIEIRRPD